MYSLLQISTLFLLCIFCIVNNSPIVTAEEVLTDTRTYDTKKEARSNCMTEVWMFRCSNVTTDAVTGLLTFEEISKVDSKICGAYMASQLFYKCTKQYLPMYVNNFLSSIREADRQCIKKEISSNGKWTCKT